MSNASSSTTIQLYAVHVAQAHTTSIHLPNGYFNFRIASVTVFKWCTLPSVHFLRCCGRSKALESIFVAKEHTLKHKSRLHSCLWPVAHNAMASIRLCRKLFSKCIILVQVKIPRNVAHSVEAGAGAQTLRRSYTRNVDFDCQSARKCIG